MIKNKFFIFVSLFIALLFNACTLSVPDKRIEHTSKKQIDGPYLTYDRDTKQFINISENKPTYGADLNLMYPIGFRQKSQSNTSFDLIFSKSEQDDFRVKRCYGFNTYFVNIVSA